MILGGHKKIFFNVDLPIFYNEEAKLTFPLILLVFKAVWKAEEDKLNC